MENATFNQTDVVSASMDCAEVQEGILASFSFWIEGITQVSIAMIGIFFNLVSMVILMDKEMRNRYVHIWETSPQKLWHEDALWFEIFLICRKPSANSCPYFLLSFFFLLLSFITPHSYFDHSLPFALNFYRFLTSLLCSTLPALLSFAQL